METGKMNAICILGTLYEQNKTEALDGNKSAQEFLVEVKSALDWVRSK